MTRSQQRAGKTGEALAEIVLRQMGIEQVERVGTPVRTIPHPTIPGYCRVIYGEPVAADYRGVLPFQLYPHTTNPESIGQSVLIEVKTIDDHNLRYSDFRPHQPGKLTEHDALGGLSLVVWVHDADAFVLRWPIPGFEPGKSVSPEWARQNDWR